VNQIGTVTEALELGNHNHDSLAHSFLRCSFCLFVYGFFSSTVCAQEEHNPTNSTSKPQ